MMIQPKDDGVGQDWVTLSFNDDDSSVGWILVNPYFEIGRKNQPDF